MLSEKALKESYVNRILAILQNENQKISWLAEQLQLKGATQNNAQMDFNNLSLLHKLFEIKNKLQKFNSSGDLFGIIANLTANNTTVELDSSHGEPMKDFGDSGFLGIISGMFKFIFNPHKGGFLYSLVAMVDNLSISLNPETKLLPKEIRASKHSDLFMEAAKQDGSFNRIYRNLISTNCTEQQILHDFFKLLKINHLNLSNKQRHDLFVLAEKKLLLGKNTLSVDTAEHIVARIKANLTKVSRLFNPNENPLLDDAQIANVTTAVSVLLKKINQQEQMLQKYITATESQAKSKEQKLEIYNYIQENKQKLYHFLLKTEAWCQGETLAKQKLFDFNYIKNQFAKFPKGDCHTDVSNSAATNSLDSENQDQTNNEEPGSRNVETFEATKSIFKLFKTYSVPGAETGTLELKNQESFSTSLDESIKCTKQTLLNDLDKCKAEVDVFKNDIAIQEARLSAEYGYLVQDLDYLKRQINSRVETVKEFSTVSLKIGEIKGKIAALEQIKSLVIESEQKLNGNIKSIKKISVETENLNKAFENAHLAKSKADNLIASIKSYKQQLDYHHLSSTSIDPATDTTTPWGNSFNLPKRTKLQPA